MGMKEGMEKNNKNKQIPFAYTQTNPLRRLFTMAQQMPNRVCMAEPRGNMVRKYRLGEFTQLVEKAAYAVSLTRGNHRKPVAIVANSSFRAIVAHFGAQLAGAKTILIPVNTPVAELLSIISDNQIEMLIVDDFSSSRELFESLHYLPELRQVWTLKDELEDYPAQVSTLGWYDMLEQSNSKRPRLDDQLAALNDDTMTTRFYSRSEVGKFQFHEYSSAQLSNFATDTASYTTDHYPGFDSIMRILSVIPFNRVAGHVEGILVPLLTGRILMAVDREEAWKSGSLPFAPQAVVGSSLFLNQATEQIQAAVKEHGGIMQYGLQKNLEHLKKRAKRGTLSNNDGQGMINFLASKTLHCLVSRKLRETFGGDIMMGFTIDREMTFESKLFYRSVALPICETRLRETLLEHAKDSSEESTFKELRGAQLAEDEEILNIKIVS